MHCVYTDRHDVLSCLRETAADVVATKGMRDADECVCEGGAYKNMMFLKKIETEGFHKRYHSWCRLQGISPSNFSLRFFFLLVRHRKFHFNLFHFAFFFWTNDSGAVVFSRFSFVFLCLFSHGNVEQHFRLYIKTDRRMGKNGKKKKIAAKVDGHRKNN